MIHLNYMLDKINLLENKDYIIGEADKVVEMLKNDQSLDNSEKLLVIELAVAKLNYDLYHISGDQQ